MPIIKEILARWPGTCRACGRAIASGDPIRWYGPDRAAGETGRSAIEHTACKPLPDQPAPEPDLEPAPDEEPHREPPPEPPADPPQPDGIEGAIAEAVWRRIKARVEATLPKADAPDKPRRAKVVRIERQGVAPITIDGAHAQLPALLALVNRRVNVYLYGPAGTGKNHAGRTVAEALGLPYREHTWCPRSSPSALFGYTDAMGRTVSTAFRDLWTNGGVMFLDEMDNAPSDVLSALNTCLASEYADFPDARVKRHPDCIILAAGNTPGYGPTLAFSDRRALPTATRTRFHFLAWDYDEPMERAVALAIAASAAVPEPAATAWTEYIFQLRAHCASSMPQVIPSPRATYHGVALLATFPIATVADLVLFQGLEASLVKNLTAACPLPSISLKEKSVS